MKYEKPPRGEKPSELRRVKDGCSGNGNEYLSLVLLIACFMVIVNFIFNIFFKEEQ